MNEIQIIQTQLATEQAHFLEVAAACARGLSAAADSDSIAACTDYFAFAITHFEPGVSEVLASQLATGLDGDFLSAFDDASRAHFGRLDAARLGRNLPVTEWRAMSRIDADSIFAERARYARFKATNPT